MGAPPQDVARLSMRCRDRQRAFFFLVVLAGERPDVFDFVHDDACTFDNFFAGAGDTVEAFALTGEQLQTKLFLEQLQLFTDPRLRGIHAIGGGRDVQAVVYDRQQILQLL